MVKSNIQSLLFLGTGPSSGIPNLKCLATKRCPNCTNVINHRTCVSLLIKTKDQPILIDCGKDFHKQYATFLNNLTSFDKVIPIVLITHEHADAILGLDSLMQMTSYHEPIKLYCDSATKQYLSTSFKYLFSKNKRSTGYYICEELKLHKEYFINNVKIVPFHVEHGKSYSVAYYIEDTILYVSDCSLFNLEITPKILIIDCTTYDKQSFGHLNFFEVLLIVKKLKPKRTYLVGMSHEIDCRKLQQKADSLHLNIFVTHDGLDIDYSQLMENLELVTQ